MEKMNWIIAKTKDNEFVKVQQKEPFSDIFIDKKGEEYTVQEIDISIRYFALDSTNPNKEIESGLDGYRAIYG